MKHDLLKASALFLYLLAPSMLVLHTGLVHGIGTAVAIVLYSTFVLLCPVLLFSSIRNYFLVLSPLALLIPPYCYVTLAYRSVPGDALVSSAIHTNAVRSLEVILSFGWKAWLIPFSVILYVAIASTIRRDFHLSGKARKTILATLLMYAMLSMGVREALGHYLTTPPFFERYTANLAFPSSLIMSVYRVMDRGLAQKDESVKGAMAVQAPESKIVVLVIGESVRSDHLGINGYSRNTTPHLGSLGSDLISFPDVATTANWTNGAVPNIVSVPYGKGRASLLQTFREAGFRTAWFSNQERSTYGRNAEVVDYAESSIDFHFRKDMDLLPLFGAFVRQAGPYQFIVLHMNGSHIPYDSRYPADSKVFRPTLSDIGVTSPQPVHKQEAINSYDNSIVETDRFLHGVISILVGTNVPAVMIYTSDHGENLFDDHRERFMHAMSPPTRYDTHVPLLVWMSGAYKKAYPVLESVIRSNSSKRISHANVFASLLDMGGVEAENYSPVNSFASPQFVEKNRMVMTSSTGDVSVSFETLE